jgi:hypothetical protein
LPESLHHTRRPWHLTSARDAAARFVAGPSGASAREQIQLATAKLALLFAEAHDRRASTFADLAAAELKAHPIAVPAVAGLVQSDLERARTLIQR